MDDTTLLVADGHGASYLLAVPDLNIPAHLVTSLELIVPQNHLSARSNVPFRLHAARKISSTRGVALLSSKYYPNTESKRPNLSNVQYDIWSVSIDFEDMSQDKATPFEILWHRRGNSVPASVFFDESRQTYILVGNSAYRSLNNQPAPSYTPSPDEIAPIPRADENLDDPSNQGPSNDLPTKPPPYSWTQTSETVTVAFPLPASTSKADIKVTFSPRTLSLLVRGNDESNSVPLPRYTTKALWDGIQSSTSYWTWDREAEHSFGLLTLYLDKQHEGTRWSQVFASAGTTLSTRSTNSDANTDVEVPETLDPSELWHIRESLEKYTAALQKGDDPSGLGLGRGVPSLGEGEMDEEIDSNIGDFVSITYVAEEGTPPSWSTNLGMDTLLSLLSTPLPGSITSEEPPSVVIKNGVDGVYFTLGNASDPSDPPTWTHTSTFSALSFVLASKRDTRFVHHIGSHVVLAFESGARDLGGNVYIYHNTPTRTTKFASQSILKIGGGSGGSLLGVGHVKTRGGETLVCCLCEGELVAMRGVP